eukprot:Skav208179  [mRNA]  locus=scaffold2530:121910:124306:+ [translate_table: standard]
MAVTLHDLPPQVAQWLLQRGDLRREQLAMVSVLMSRQAQRHPAALTRQAHSLEEVQWGREDGDASPKLGPVAAQGGVVILGGGEASGPLYPPAPIDESMFSCEAAARSAFSEAQLVPEDIQWFGLYDCYPVCFVRALEACGVTAKGGAWVEEMFHRTAQLGEC